MTDKVFKTIERHSMFCPGDTVGVGLSGGADSVALTHFLAVNCEKLSIKRLKAVHIHHGIRGAEADRDLEFSKKFCESLGIELLIFKADVPAAAEETGESIEECARRLRYEFFESAGCDKFATAHNLNDNMETFFFNIARGTALTGLCGIPFVRGIYVRPLLECTRQEIESYISENGLSFITDSTNLCDDYTRNKIRHNLLPLFFELNPSFDNAFSRCLDSLYMTRDFVDTSAENLFERADRGDYFDCTVLSNAPEALKFQTISLILKSLSVKNITREHISLVNNIIENGGTACLPGKICVTVERKLLREGASRKTPYFEAPVTGDEKFVTSPAGKYEISFHLKKDLQNLNKEVLDNLIDCDKISGNLVLRNRREGDSVKLFGRGVTKTLKKLFNESKIPASKRDRIAILSDDCGIVWTEGFGVCERCKPSRETKKYLYLKKVGDEKC